MVKFNRIKISTDATARLKVLKGRTGLTPNILARIALCYSLNTQRITNIVKPDEEGQEFNRYTLTGEYDAYFVALVKERCLQDGLDPEKNFIEQFKIHLNNGIMAIYSRINDISDLTNLLKGN
ncbi:DNA sulfur modification protein DndE [Candidatus Woesearchaeota archaeon]|nr:MAG: DNA sulfur modification protein DndE [Candidatus Woesearchaeota archaeon]